MKEGRAVPRGRPALLKVTERGVALGQAEAARRRGEVDEVAGREVAEDVRDHACREAVSCGNAADQASTTEGVAISPSTSRMAAIR